MTIFRWIIGAFTVLFALGSALSFALFMAFDIDVWIQRARAFRHWLYLTLLLWFNIEIWGRVVWTIVKW